MRISFIFFVSVWSVFVSQRALAQRPATDSEARAIFDAGQIAFQAGRFEDALARFEESYRLSQRPALLFNIGLTADRARDDARAIEAFEQFIELAPDHSNVLQARGRLETLRRQQAEREQVEREPVEREQVEREQVEREQVEREQVEREQAEQQAAQDTHPEAKRSRTGTWLLGIGGGVVALTGIVLVGTALSTKNDIESQEAPEWVDIADDVDAVPRRSGAGIALLGIGTAMAVSSLLWRLLTPNAPVTVGVGRGQLRLEGQF